MPRIYWLTVCMYTVSQYILGIRPDYEGLRIDPCIPAEWDGFSVTRKFRGAVYHIKVLNPGHKSKGVKEMTVDGVIHQTDILPLFPEGTEHEITLIIG